MENENYLAKRKKNAAIIKRVAVITLIINVLLTVLKAVFGAVFLNVSVLSDSIHSLSDAGTTVLVLVAAFISKPDEDDGHNYGHEKREPLITLLFATILGAVGVMLTVQGVKGIISPKEVSINYYLLAVTALSIVTKEVMYRYTIHYAKKTRSDALTADAWHHRSDSLSSIAVLIGLICSPFLHNDLAESIAVILVSALIIKVAVQILKTSVDNLVDKAADESTCAAIKTLILETKGVEGVDKLKTRIFGNAIYVDVEICVDGTMTVEASHGVAEAVHDKLESHQEYSIKHCTVHVNPYCTVNDVK